MALNYLNKGDYNSAINEYKKLIIRNSRNYIFYVNLAEIYISLSINVDESLALLQKSISINPNYFKALNLMDVCLRNKGKIKESLSYFKKSILIKPNEALTFFNLALTF